MWSSEMITWLETSMHVGGSQPREEKMVGGARVVLVEEGERVERYLRVHRRRWWVGSGLGGCKFQFTRTALVYGCSFSIILNGSSLYPQCDLV